MGSFMGRGNQYIQLVKVLYCKQLTTSKKLPSFPHRVSGFEPLTSEMGGECITTVATWPQIFQGGSFICKYASKINILIAALQLPQN